MDALSLSESYLSVERLISSTCRKFLKRYNLDEQEVFSEAGVAFLKATESFNPAKGTKFSTWIRWKLYKDLMSLARKQRQSLPLDSIQEPATERKFFLREFLEDLSEDTRMVAKMALNTPKEILQAMRRDTTYDLRIAIWQHLREIGWSTRKIIESFSEIRRAL